MVHGAMIFIQKRDKIIVKFLLSFSVIVFSMMKLLAILQVKADKTITTQSHSTRDSPIG